MMNGENYTKEEVNKQRVRRYLESFASAVPDQVSENVHADFQNRHLAILGKPCEGKDQYTERLGVFLNEFKDIKYALIGLVVDGESGACKYIMSFNIAGRKYEIPGMMWFDFLDGLILRRVDCWDGLDFLKKSDADAERIAALIR